MELLKNYISLQKLLIEIYCITLHQMANQTAMEKSNNKKIAQFQVGYIPYACSNHNKAFTDQVEINTG